MVVRGTLGGVGHVTRPGAAGSVASPKYEETAGTATIGRAEALRRSMLALMATPDKPYYAHPLFWAPFVVVGEGAAP